jgi:hypothetical protein
VGEINNTYRILVGKRKWKRQEVNIRKDLRYTGLEVADWVHLAQDGDRWQAVVNTVINVLIP